MLHVISITPELTAGLAKMEKEKISLERSMLEETKPIFDKTIDVLKEKSKNPYPPGKGCAESRYQEWLTAATMIWWLLAAVAWEIGSRYCWEALAKSMPWLSYSRADSKITAKIYHLCIFPRYLHSAIIEASTTIMEG